MLFRLVRQFAANFAFQAGDQQPVKGVLGRTIAGRTPQTSVELAELILDEAEVAVVPGEAFGPSGYLRLSYALGDDDLAEGISRMGKLLSEAH